MAKIDPHVKRPVASRWREPLVSGGHEGLACPRVLESDPGRMCESMHASMGHIRSPPPSRSRFIVRFSGCTHVCNGRPIVYYNHCAKLCPIFRVLCASIWCRIKAVCVESSNWLLCFLNVWYAVLKFLAHSPWRVEKVNAAVTPVTEPSAYRQHLLTLFFYINIIHALGFPQRFQWSVIWLLRILLRIWFWESLCRYIP